MRHRFMFLVGSNQCQKRLAESETNALPAPGRIACRVAHDRSRDSRGGREPLRVVGELRRLERRVMDIAGAAEPDRIRLPEARRDRRTDASSPPLRSDSAGTPDSR